MTIGRISLGIFFIGLALYIGAQFLSLLSPPPLELFAPRPGLITSGSTIEVKGKTTPGATVKINGSPLALAQSGEFGTILVLNRGINTITVAAKRRYSKTTTIERQILILENSERISRGDSGGI